VPPVKGLIRPARKNLRSGERVVHIRCTLASAACRRPPYTGKQRVVGEVKFELVAARSCGVGRFDRRFAGVHLVQENSG